MPDLIDDIRAVLERVPEEYTKGPWFVATSCSWRRILTAETDRPVVVPEVARDGHPDLYARQEDLDLTAIAPDLHRLLTRALEALVDS